MMGMLDALSGSEFDDRPPDDVREDVDVKGGGADLQGEVGDLLPVVLLIDVTREKRGGRTYICYTQPPETRYHLDRLQRWRS